MIHHATASEPPSSPVSDLRAYPDRPYVAVSAAIIRDGKVLIVRRARPPAEGLFTLPGGAVETGERLTEAVVREVREETQLEIEPAGLAGFREVIVRDDGGRIERHFVVLCFAARYVAGQPVANEELAEIHWMDPAEIAALRTTEGLGEIVAQAVEKLGKA
jgi:ADP-ribose pyrophosphatase YjhB (NUDIX family)